MCMNVCVHVCLKIMVMLSYFWDLLYTEMRRNGREARRRTLRRE